MARTDQRKLESWARRVQQHRTSGLSVSKYCQREELAVHDFYYWRRKLAGPVQPISRMDIEKQGPLAVGPAVRTEQANGGDVAAMVQIQLGSGASVSVPAHSPDAIRTVLETLLRCNSGSLSSSPSSAFHPVILRS